MEKMIIFSLAAPVPNHLHASKTYGKDIAQTEQQVRGREGKREGREEGERVPKVKIFMWDVEN